MNKIEPRSLAVSADQKKGSLCLSCGVKLIRLSMRYCSQNCQKKLKQILAFTNPLLRQLRAKYASFSFSESAVFLDVRSDEMKYISRFMRSKGIRESPSESLLKLINEVGEVWYENLRETRSGRLASLKLFNSRIDEEIVFDDITWRNLRLDADTEWALSKLKLESEVLLQENYMDEVKSAYRTLANVFHPDKGGSEKK